MHFLRRFLLHTAVTRACSVPAKRGAPLAAADVLAADEPRASRPAPGRRLLRPEESGVFRFPAGAIENGPQHEPTVASYARVED